MKDYFIFGEMAERSNAAVLKTVDCNRSGGSNPSLSANKGVNQWITWFTPFITPKIKHLRNKLHPRLIVLGVVRYWERFIGLRKARFHIRYNPNQPFGKTQLPASFRLAWRLCVWKCSWTNSCSRSYEYTSCEIFACNSLFKLNIVQRVKMYFCFFAKRIIICWFFISVMPIT